MDFITQPWAWYVAGPLLAFILFMFLYFGKTFGVSSNFQTICAIGGAGKFADYFNFDWKSKQWNLVFLLGSIIGGFIAHKFLMPIQEVALNEAAVNNLQQKLGFKNIGTNFLPLEIFGIEALKSFKGILILIIGGFFIGFGTRYANGCTAGHAITGLSNLELPSLIAVIGFFIGGLFMTHLVLPLIY